MTLIETKSKIVNTEIDVVQFRRDLLEWYKLNARIMPWRAAYGERPNPYHEWLSEIMLQQTVVKAVIPYFLKFIKLWPEVRDLAAAPVEDVMQAWAGLGYYARARNLHKCANVISSEYDGIFPDREEELLKLPGIGPYTAAAISAIAFGNPATVMDGNVERVLSRLYRHDQLIRSSKKVLYGYVENLSAGCTDFPGEFAQAMMEIGALICTPQSPKCMICPLSSFCEAYKYNQVSDFPLKSVKTAKKTRYGTLYFIKKGDSVLLERRIKKGLLGGMNGIPGSLWQEDNVSRDDVIDDFNIIHTFTHFNLILTGMYVKYSPEIHDQDKYFWCKVSEYDKIGLPSLFKKAMKQFYNLNKND